jgi:hypothetical protein
MKKLRLKDGSLIEYNDALINTTQSRLSFIDRIRVMLGSKIIIITTTYVENEELKIVGNGVPVTIVERIFTSKNNKKELGEILSENNPMSKTPKEYVEELIDKFRNRFIRNRFIISNKDAKECAKICIEELQQTERKYDNYGMVVYYDECLTELNNL